MANRGLGMRLTKESQRLVAMEGMSLNIVDETHNIWHVTFAMPANTVYAGEQFTLQFKFEGNYPFEAPEVIFVGTPPIHKHVYSNGFICLSTLSKDWTPALHTGQVVLSIQSMLASADKKELPPNHDASVSYMNRMGSPKRVNWEFDDDTC